MPEKQQQALDKISQLEEQLTDALDRYWLEFSNFQTWQFWVLVAMLITPLVALYFLLDKKRAFHIGFFGLNIHVWTTYADVIGASRGLWRYPYKVHSYLPSSVLLDTSLVPVAFMLVYQWSRHRKRHQDLFFYMAALVLSALFSFGFKPLMGALGLLELQKGMNYWHLLPIYIGIFLISKWITQLFLWFQVNAK